MLQLQVGVEKITFSGRVRMTMKPLMDEMPIVAALQVRTVALLHHVSPVTLKATSLVNADAEWVLCITIVSCVSLKPTSLLTSDVEQFQ